MGERGNAKMHIYYMVQQANVCDEIEEAHTYMIFNLYRYDKHQLQTPKGLWDKTRNRLKEHSSDMLRVKFGLTNQVYACYIEHR